MDLGRDLEEVDCFYLTSCCWSFFIYREFYGLNIKYLQVDLF